MQTGGMATRERHRSSCRRLIALAFIEGFFVKYGWAPSFGEIGRWVGLPSSRVGKMLDDMEAIGMLTRIRGVSRSIVLPSPGANLSNDQILLELKRRGFVVYPPMARATEFL